MTLSNALEMAQLGVLIVGGFAAGRIFGAQENTLKALQLAFERLSVAVRDFENDLNRRVSALEAKQ